MRNCWPLQTRPFADGNGVTDPVNNRMGSACFLRHDDQSAWAQPHSPLGPCPMLWMSEEGSGNRAPSPPPRHVSNGPLSGSRCLMRPASQSSSLSCFPGRAATSVVREGRACSIPDVRPWVLQRGSQEHRRWQERTVRGPRWHMVTCSPSRDRMPLSSSRAGSSRGPKACVPLLRFKQAS